MSAILPCAVCTLVVVVYASLRCTDLESSLNFSFWVWVQICSWLRCMLCWVLRMLNSDKSLRGLLFVPAGFLVVTCLFQLYRRYGVMPLTQKIVKVQP